MNANTFRKMALRLPETTEGEHMGHPDFRVGGKIFATIGPDGDWGMVNLTAEQQAVYVNDEPDVFAPANGAWGRGGSTIIQLTGADRTMVAEAMRMAWLKRAPKNLAARHKDQI